MRKSNAIYLNPRRAAVLALIALLLGAIYLLVAERLDRLDASMNEVAQAAGAVIQENAAREMLANEIRLNAEQSEGKLALLFFIGKKENRIPVYGEMDRHNAAFDQALARITPLLTSTVEKQILTRLLVLRQTFRDNMQETVDALELDDREKAETLLSTVTRDNLHELRELVARLINEQRNSISARQKAVLEEKSATDAALSQDRAIAIGSGLAAAAVILLLGMLLLGRKAR